MKRSLNLSLALLVAFSASGLTVQTAQANWFTNLTWKQKLIAAVTAATVVGMVMTTKHQSDLVTSALEQTGLQINTPLGHIAAGFVAAFGPLGKQALIKIVQATKFTSPYVAPMIDSLVQSDLGKAIAYYWGITHQELLNLLGLAISHPEAITYEDAQKAVAAMLDKAREMGIQVRQQAGAAINVIRNAAGNN